VVGFAARGHASQAITANNNAPLPINASGSQRGPEVARRGGELTLRLDMPSPLNLCAITPFGRARFWVPVYATGPSLTVTKITKSG
jgi:hypothetical protein